MNSKWKLIAMLGVLMLVLAGCGGEQEAISADSEGIWNRFFVYPFSWLLITIAQFFNGDYGLSIIAVTIIIRIVLLPLFIKQQNSAIAMKRLQPRMKELQEKYSSKNQAEAQKLQQEMMKLYREEGVNPMMGCLPILLQMPILMAFYFAIQRTEELAAHSFLWVDLGEPDPFFIFPILAGVMMFLQTKITAKDMPENMRPIMMLMPVMMIVAGIFLPSALSLYWATGGVFMIFQTLVFTKRKEKMEETQQEKTTT